MSGALPRKAPPLWAHAHAYRFARAARSQVKDDMGSSGDPTFQTLAYYQQLYLVRTCTPPGMLTIQLYQQTIGSTYIWER